MCPITIASTATASIAVHRAKLPNGSVLQKMLANAQRTSSTSVVGTRRSSDTSARRTTRMPSPIAHSAAMMVRSVTTPTTRERKCAPTSAAKTARV